LVLAPVIFLSIYYLFAMGWIVDRIVSVDAPAATLAQQASIQMLEARRAERNYFLLRDPAYLKANQNSLATVTDTLKKIRSLQPDEEVTTQQVIDAVNLYQQRFSAAVAASTQPGKTPADRVRAVLQNYEAGLNNLVKRDRLKSRAALVDELRDQVGSFDTQITNTVENGDPTLRQVTDDLERSSAQVVGLTSALETRNWQRVQDDHRQARQLLRRAEWVLSVVSALVIFLSVWISFVLPREVVRPLITLKNAVDYAASGNYRIQLRLRGRGEVVDLARSVQNLILHITPLDAWNPEPAAIRINA
jgi:CHASE3 domain sensor protein